MTRVRSSKARTQQLWDVRITDDRDRLAIGQVRLQNISRAPDMVLVASSATRAFASVTAIRMGLQRVTP